MDALAHLDEIDVVPEYGQRGVGKGGARGVRVGGAGRHETVTLSTFRDVPFNAPFYSRLGFVPVATADLLPEHTELVKREQAHGLCVDKRLIMECRTGAQEHATME